ncbi:hypothetical protein [Thermomonas brevis]
MTMITIQPRQSLVIQDASLHVLPSTQIAIQAAQQIASDELLLIADDKLVLDAISPSQYLALCGERESRGDIAPSGMIFTDQFAQPHLTPILVQRGDHREFMSAIELLACGRYCLDLYVWVGPEWRHVPAVNANKDQRTVLRALADYFDASASLGDAWLARKRQWQRMEKARKDAALSRLRHYASFLMQSHPCSPMEAEDMAVLRELTARRHVLSSIKEPATC